MNPAIETGTEVVQQTTIHMGVLDFFIRGGFFMYPILFVSLLALTIAIERFLALHVRYSIDGRRLFNDIKKYLTNGDSQRALEVCRQHANNPLAQVLGAGLANSKDLEAMDTAMESEALFFVPKITERLSYLAGLSNIATLLGLLGTIAGLIMSFAAVGENNLEVAKEEALAGGIAVAMYCTAFGLIVAIPTLLAYHYLMGKSNRLVDDIQHYATALKKIVWKSKHGGLEEFEGRARKTKASEKDPVGSEA